MQARLVIPVDRKPILTVDYVIGEGGEELLALGQRESFPEFRGGSWDISPVR